MYYDTIAPGYDELYEKEQLHKLQYISHIIKGKVLDIGAGTGIVAKKFPNVTSLDPSAGMLQFAPEPKVVAKAESIPFKRDEFDTIVSLTALHHTDIDQVIKEMQRLNPKNIGITILKKSKKCEEIIAKLQKAFNMKILEEEKDIILIKECKR
jgi:ubiquinone/menaquinone biosynthesis C-methylase UbiE